jgi:transcriptional regulator with XRE-family HTH domain
MQTRTSAAAKVVGMRIRQLRLRRGWSQTQVLRRMAVAASAAGVRLPSPASMHTNVSMWENGHRLPGPLYRELLARVLGEPVYLTPRPLAHRRHNAAIFERMLPAPVVYPPDPCLLENVADVGGPVCGARRVDDDADGW